MEVVWNTIVPVFAVVAAGYVMAARLRPDAQTLANLALWIASPSLVFSLMSGTSIDALRFAELTAGIVFVMGVNAVLGVVYRRVFDVGRGFLLPVIFLNSGNMGLACSRLAFGSEGLEAAAVPFVIASLGASLFGVWIAKGENGFAEALRLPLLWSAVGGLGVAGFGVALPRLVMEPIEMLGGMAIPLMLLNLGLQLRSLDVSDFGHSVGAVALRMLGGLAAAWVFTGFFGIEGIDRGVLLLMSVMPAAVINAVLAERYQTDTALVASSIVLGTLASLVAIPLVLLLV